MVSGGHGVLIKGYGDDLDGDDLNSIRMTMIMVMMRRNRMVSGGHGELTKGSVVIQIFMPGLSNHDHDDEGIFIKMVRMIMTILMIKTTMMRILMMCGQWGALGVN